MEDNEDNINKAAIEAAVNSLNGNAGNTMRIRESVENATRRIAENNMSENALGEKKAAIIQASKGHQTSQVQPPASQDQALNIEKIKLWLTKILKDNNAFLNFLTTTPITNDVKQIILQFANQIDGVINLKTELDYTHNDDIFMLYFLIKYGQNLNADEKETTNLKLIHIGWSLAKIIIISSFRSKQYVIEDPIDETNTLLKIDIGDTENPRHAFLLEKTLNKIWNKTEAEQAAFENRILQIYTEQKLEENENLKNFFNDFPPTIEEINSKRIEILKKGGKNKKSTKERINFNGKNRIVYVGPKGGRYIKNGGDFVRIK